MPRVTDEVLAMLTDINSGKEEAAMHDLRDLRAVARKIVEAYRNKTCHDAIVLIMEELAPLVEDGGGR